MTDSYRLRVELDDRPGALAAVTGALAAAGGNLASIDIHETDPSGRVVDDIVVVAPVDDDLDLGALVASVEALPGVSVLHANREDRGQDPVVNALRWARQMLAAGPETDLELGRAILEVCRAAVAWVSGAEEARALEPGRLALAQGENVARSVDSLHSWVRSPISSPCWLLAVPDDETDPTLVAFAARQLSIPFSTSEMARLRGLMALRRQLAGPVQRTRDSPVPSNEGESRA